MSGLQGLCWPDYSVRVFFFRALKHTGGSEGLNWCNRSLGDGVKAGWRTHVSAAEGTQAKPSGAQSETADRCGDKLVSY